MDHACFTRHACELGTLTQLAGIKQKVGPGTFFLFQGKGGGWSRGSANVKKSRLRYILRTFFATPNLGFLPYGLVTAFLFHEHRAQFVAR